MSIEVLITISPTASLVSMVCCLYLHNIVVVAICVLVVLLVVIAMVAVGILGIFFLFLDVVVLELKKEEIC